MSSSAPKPSQPAPDRLRRRHARYRTNFPVAVELLISDSYQQLTGHCRDLSEAGMGILLAADLKSGEVASLAFSLPDSVLWEIRSVVRHRRGYQYGFEFLSLT